MALQDSFLSCLLREWSTHSQAQSKGISPGDTSPFSTDFLV